MTEKSLTLLELHLDDSHIQLGPRTLSTGSPKADDARDSVDVIEDAEESGGDESAEGSGFSVGGPAKAGLALLVVVSLALAVWKLLGEGDLEAVEELDELAE
ncbi:MAG: hypothetical protein ABEH81_16400 [Halopenitus sp.]